MLRQVAANQSADSSAHSKLLLRETVAVFTRDDEGLDHLRLFEVAVELIQLVQPEREARGIRIAAQVAHVFHHHKRLVELRLPETSVFSNASQRLSPRH